MRLVLILALLAASPAVACDMEGMFGFNHYSAVTDDAAAAEAMREAAIAQARDNFMARHGMAQPADAGSVDGGTAAVEVAAVSAAPAYGVPK
jgi:hypothetical protein